MSKTATFTSSQTDGDAFLTCRAALLNCAAAATDVSVLFMFADDASCRDQARSSLLCAHACVRTLRLMAEMQEDGGTPLWAELQLAARLCETFVAECHEERFSQREIGAWRASCLLAAAACHASVLALLNGNAFVH